MVFLIVIRYELVNEMAEKREIIIVIDVEATCWKESPPPGQEKEIIEIGICPLEATTGERLPTRSIIVKPEKSTVSDFCTQLTTLTQEQVNKGITLNEACSILEQEYLTRSRTWASWGDYDRRQFEKECKLKNITYPFGPNHVNIKRRFAREQNLSQEVELIEALQLLGLKFEGTYHRAVDDAFNIAFVLSKLILK